MLKEKITRSLNNYGKILMFLILSLYLCDVPLHFILLVIWPEILPVELY